MEATQDRGHARSVWLRLHVAMFQQFFKQEKVLIKRCNKLIETKEKNVIT